ncbi:hypothetical protein [uncultured Paludibaculum sp.]|uniref:hypothetical protein n=1 Tax=uncultured Paludibaculum sp. TaxID=1765020 RepID=UPI002AAAA1B2|nr:hypothetical protein [uncultured Paludibaculum sp.]
MGTHAPLDLSALDDKLLDGLRFCTKVYDLFDQIRSEPDGPGKIRLLSSKREKRLLEELIPIAQYIQARYRVGNRMKVRWLSGSQPYDAVIWTPLPMVNKGGMPRKITIEVTTSTHQFAHIARKQLHETGGSFGPKGVQIDKATRTSVSKPHVYHGREHISDLALQIVERLTAKAKKEYPPNTVLIINCETDGLIFEDEWKTAIQEVEGLAVHKSFREVFLVASRGNHSACLWGSDKQQQRRKASKHPAKPFA